MPGFKWMTTSPGVAVAATFVILLVVLAIMYNRLVRARIRVHEAWSGIAVQLQRRADLVPNLVEIVKGYGVHEREIFETVAKARAAMTQAAGPAEAGLANTGLTHALGRLFAVIENYPTLRASDNFHSLQRELAAIEERIAYARQFYNRNVLAYNTLIATLPSMPLARSLHFERENFFDTEGSSKDPVAVHLN